MKRTAIVLLVSVLLLCLTACQKKEVVNIEPPGTEQVDAEVSDDIARADEMLGIAYEDMLGYYRILSAKALALTDEEFKSYDVSGLKLRDRQDDVRVYFESDWSLGYEEGADDRTVQRFDLTDKAFDFYVNVESIKDSEFRDNVIDICNNLHAYLAELADYLGIDLPDDVVEITEPSVADAQTIPNSRWDGSVIAGTMNGYSIIFSNGKAYLGITYEDDETIISSGQACTYDISDGKIYFKSVDDPRTGVMNYDGSTIKESSIKSETIFEPNYVFTKSYDLP